MGSSWPPDVPALVAALERLLDDPERRLAMGLAARRRVENAHSWEDYGSSVLSTIRDGLQPAA
jgi:glycosyltransferase involved in cell wall biosynthesis